MADKDVELHERVAKIEQQVEHIDEIASERHGQLKAIRKQLDDMDKRNDARLDTMEKDLERYRGMVGAILLIATALTTFFKLFWQDILKFFR